MQGLCFEIKQLSTSVCNNLVTLNNSNVLCNLGVSFAYINIYASLAFKKKKKIPYVFTFFFNGRKKRAEVKTG